ncbi:MAG: hypothetical protein IPN51_12150 [Chloracidobacterium sp.]|nr:hypothetical protein [Chloracidobacterium sp.]
MFLFSEGGGHHTPLIVEFINHYVGEPVYHFQMAYTRPIWVAFFNKFGTTPERSLPQNIRLRPRFRGTR